MVHESSLKLVQKNNAWVPSKEGVPHILEQYGITVWDKVLGEGGYAKVKLAYSSHLDMKLAVKIVNKKKASRNYLTKYFTREIRAMYHLDHPNIIKMHEVVETNHNIYIAMDLAEGGDLLDYINNKKYSREDEVKKHFKQIMSAMDYCHRQGFVHRDIKCENILLDKYGNIIITDFGFSRNTTKHDLLQTYCGSFTYCCPEILRGDPYNGFAADRWSIGVVLFIMLTSRLPYRLENLQWVATRQGTGFDSLTFPKHVSNYARDVVERLLEPNPLKRATFALLKHHPWITPILIPPELAASHGYKFSSTEGIIIDPTLIQQPKHHNQKQSQKQMSTNDEKSNCILNKTRRCNSERPRSGSAKKVYLQPSMQFEPTPPPMDFAGEVHKAEREEEKENKLGRKLKIFDVTRTQACHRPDDGKILTGIVQPRTHAFHDTLMRKRATMLAITTFVRNIGEPNNVFTGKNASVPEMVVQSHFDSLRNTAHTMKCTAVVAMASCGYAKQSSYTKQLTPWTLVSQVLNTERKIVKKQKLKHCTKDHLVRDVEILSDQNKSHSKKKRWTTLKTSSKLKSIFRSVKHKKDIDHGELAAKAIEERKKDIDKIKRSKAAAAARRASISKKRECLRNGQERNATCDDMMKDKKLSCHNEELREWISKCSKLTTTV